MESDRPCFDCLHRQIQSDFSDQIIFSYGVSDSSLPFGSSAVVQLPSSTGEAFTSESASSQFILEYMRIDGNDCLRNYVDEFIVENHVDGVDDVKLSGTNEDEVKFSNEIPKGTSLSSFQDAQSCIGKKESSDEIAYGNSTCTHSSRLACWRTITALVPTAQIGNCSYSTFKELTTNYFDGCLEDHILCSLNLLIEGKVSPRESVNFLRLVGLNSFEENGIPGCLRHPNIAPILGLLKSSNFNVSILPKAPYTLENILYYSPDVLNSEWHKMFLIYQLLSALVYLHGLGVAHGNICPSNITLTSSCWSWLRICNKLRSENSSIPSDRECTVPSQSRKGWCSDSCYSYGLYADMKLFSSSSWNSHFDRWWRGELSNFEYLLLLNKLAGRRWGDHTFHPVLPWVIDFSAKPDEDSDSGWRDLSKSKWRLAKGDEQLDFTYSTSEFPHHVSDECLSELAVCSYKARRLPLSVLRRAVRSVYEPNEYPSNMQRLYHWTPDECIPEFYCDAQIFYSLHSGMNDLAVPSWAGSPEEFVKLHRDALDSCRVSSQIHNWIDIVFGYKMSGSAALEAKNVMLPSSEPAKPRSVGRRQLFTQPHPVRRGAFNNNKISKSDPAVHTVQINGVDEEKSVLFDIISLQEMEEASKFSEQARHLSPLYQLHQRNQVKQNFIEKEAEKRTPMSSIPNHNDHILSSNVELNCILEHIEVEDEGSMRYEELLLWLQKYLNTFSEDIANDIFSVGCLLAELYSKRPLFDAESIGRFVETGVLPGSIEELPPHTRVLVEACIERDWKRRPSAKSLLECPYFPTTLKSSYLFIAPLQLIAKDKSRLRYAASFAKKGALKAMGTFAAEMCAPHCLPLVVNPLSDEEAEWAYILLKEFIKCLTQKAVKKLILPAVQKILKATGYSHLKVSLLQASFVRVIWNRIGKPAYLETIHSLVICNLCICPHKISASAASVLLIGSSEELGVPITVHQTILPLIHCFGKGLCLDGIDVLIRIGGLLGENFIVKQILPLLKHVVHSCIGVSSVNKPEAVQSWSSLAVSDCLMTLDGLVAFLPSEVLIKELIEDRSCLQIMILMQKTIELPVQQVAAVTLMTICEQIGPDLTALHVLPHLKELFDELAFSKEAINGSGSLKGNLRDPRPKSDVEYHIESRMDLVFLLYPFFVSLLGIEKVRLCCSTWLLLEQYLLRSHNWKWEYTRETSGIGAEKTVSRKPALIKGSTSDHSPAKLLLNGVGWSIPQSQRIRGSKLLVPKKRISDVHPSLVERQEAASNLMKHEPWFWFPSPVVSWDGPEFFGRFGGLKDEIPWKIRASVLSSVRAHHGALRSLAVCQDEGTVFTAGISPGFKGTVQKWELTRLSCVSGYYGHEEVVNDISILSSTGRIASCDGTIHVWNNRTGKLISVFTEPSADAHIAPLSSSSKTNADKTNMLNSSALSSGILNSAFDGSLYTCMHHLDFVDRLAVGTTNGSVRFIDVNEGRKLHLWRGQTAESDFPSLVSALSSCGSDKMQADGNSASPSWIAAGLSSGNCRLFDVRSGRVICTWRAHDGYVTQLAAPEDHLLVSSSLDKTLRIWDLRRNLPPQPTIFKGHRDGVSGFSLWGQDVISISRNKIGLFSLSKQADEDGQHRVIPQKLYTAENGARNLSILSSISILPFSRLFLVGTEDGHLRICC